MRKLVHIPYTTPLNGAHLRREHRLLRVSILLLVLAMASGVLVFADASSAAHIPAGAKSGSGRIR